MYHAVGETEPMLPGGPRSPSAKMRQAGGGPGSPSAHSMRLDTPATKCNDWFFALLFVAHYIVIAVFAFWKGVPVLYKRVAAVLADDDSASTPTGSDADDNDYGMVFAWGGALVATAALLSLFWMKFLMSYAAEMIRIALWLNVVVIIVFAGATFAANPLAAFVFLGMAAINVCYICLIRNRIGFASANLKAACAAISAHSTIFIVALLMILKQATWLMLWTLSAIGVYQLYKEADPACDSAAASSTDGSEEGLFCGGTSMGFAVFFMLISLYWGQQVVQNVLTCTTAGVVATWWYNPHPKHVTFGALYRSVTSSFGSICFGSLIVAILHAMRTMAALLKEQAREEDNAVLACIACLAECCLNCLESIMEYFNQWAFVYVGIYGYSFRTSGKAVMDLFRNRGWTALINDDLTSTALTFGAVGVGIVTSCLGLLLVKFGPDEWFAVLGSANAQFGTMAAIGFVAGLCMALILANVVITALHTVFVCFAEDPIAFSRNHPEEYEHLVDGWRKFNGDALTAAYGSTV